MFAQSAIYAHTQRAGRKKKTKRPPTSPWEISLSSRTLCATLIAYVMRSDSKTSQRDVLVHSHANTTHNAEGAYNAYTTVINVHTRVNRWERTPTGCEGQEEAPTTCQSA